MPTESAWSPASPAIDDYFVIAEILATEPAEGHKCRGYLPPFTFEILPGPMGPAPAAHAPTHELGGMDPIPVETLATAARDTGLRLAPDGAGGLTFATGGGSAGTPSDTVTSETSPGQTPNAGASSNYSRGDHTHGTPPTAGGEPGGNDTDIQYNSSGAFAGSDDLQYDHTNKQITMPTPGGATTEYAATHLKIGQDSGNGFAYIFSDGSLGLQLYWKYPTYCGVFFASVCFDQR